MSGLEAAAPVPIATAIVAEIASPAMWLLGRRTAALLDRDTVPTSSGYGTAFANIRR